MKYNNNSYTDRYMLFHKTWIFQLIFGASADYSLEGRVMNEENTALMNGKGRGNGQMESCSAMSSECYVT